MINNSSVNMYATRKFKDKLKMKETIESANDINNKCATAITEGISCLKKIIPNISNLISPIIQVAYNMQNKIGSVNLKKITTSENGIWQSEICVNAKTNQFHTEKDVTYTFITVPQQILKSKTGNLRNNTFFLFQMNEATNVSLKMIPNLSFIFSGAMLSHRQHCDKNREASEEKEIELFFNIACYGNQKLFHYLQKSFQQNMV